MNANTDLDPRMKGTCRPRSFLVLALGFLCATYLVMLFYRGFSDPSEGRYAEAPREMVESGRWLEMRLFGYYYYEKPPLAYWTVAPAIAAFGARDWAARIPLLLNAIAVVILFLVLVRKSWPRPVGSLSILVGAATVGFIGGICMLLTDPFLALWFTIACVCLRFGFEPGASHGRRALFLLPATIAAFLGFLTKGAVAVALPGLIVLLWLLWEKRPSALLTPGLPAAAILFLALLVPALWLLEQHNPGFFRQFIYEEHLARFMGTRESQLHAEPAWFYAYIVPVMMLPWSFFALRAIRTLAVKRVLSTRRHEGFPESNDSLSRFLLVWALGVIVFFSLSRGKMMSYIVPAVLPMALLLGRWGVAEPVSNEKTDKRLWMLGLIGMFIPATGVAGIWTVSYFRLIPGDPYRITGAAALALLPVAASLFIVFQRRVFRAAEGLIVFASGTLLGVALLLSPLAGKDFNVEAHNNFSIVYKSLASVLEPDDQVVVLWEYRPSLSFYCRRKTILFQEKNELEFGINLEPGRGKRYLDTAEELKELVQACPGRVFAVIEPKYIESRFLPMGIRHVPAPAPVAGNPDTAVFQLLPKED